MEPIAPSKAKEMYLAQRREDVSEATLQAHHYRLKHLVRWCEKVEEITNLNELSPRLLFEYRQWRKEDGDLNSVTLQTQLSTVKVFLKFCESIEAVEEGLHDKVMLPSVDKGEDARDGMLEVEDAEAILSYLRRFEYASKRHALMAILWLTSCRIGAVHSLDVSDFDAENRTLTFAHRPETGTSLKNGKDGERLCALPDDVAEVVSDYIEVNRPDVTDSEGRKPLFATSNGRMHKSNIRDMVYAATRPCAYGQDCPHDRNPDDCEATRYNKASKCPSSCPPHDCRRGSITRLLREEVPKTVVSDRANVSPDVLDKHYNQMTEEEKMEQRRQYVERL
jgi:site-specific recombinase XerD